MKSNIQQHINLPLILVEFLIVKIPFNIKERTMKTLKKKNFQKDKEEYPFKKNTKW